MNSKVSLIKETQSYEGTLQVLNQIKQDILHKILKSKKMVIKINMVAAVVELACTPVECVKAYIDFVRENGYTEEITIAEASVITGTPIGFRKMGYTKLAKDYKDVTLLNLNNDDTIPFVMKTSTGVEIPVTYPKTIKESDYLVSVTRAKTHDTVVATLSIKNLAVGGIVHGRNKVHHGKDIHPILVSVINFKKPELGIVDGVVGMQGDGPAWGFAAKFGWVAASEDLLALDTLGSYLMGFELKDIGYLTMLGDQHFGNVYPGDFVEVIGANPSGLVMKYAPHKTYQHQIDWRQP